MDSANMENMSTTTLPPPVLPDILPGGEPTVVPDFVSDVLTDDDMESFLNAPQPCEWGTFSEGTLLMNGKPINKNFEDCPETAEKWLEVMRENHRVLVGLCKEHYDELTK